MKFFKNSKDGSVSACCRRDGFTLIELLVVIAIISLLASVILASLSSARARGRDAKRKSDLHQILVAVELYRNDNNGNPIGAASIGWYTQFNNTCHQPYSYVVPQYMASSPEDPNSPGTPASCTPQDGWWYYYGRGVELDASGTSIVNASTTSVYIICSKLENTSDSAYKVINSIWGASYKLNYCLSGK